MKLSQAVVFTLALALADAACASVKQNNPNPDGTGGSVRGTVGAGGTGGDVRGTAGTSGGTVGCQRLQCQKVVCPNGGKTTVSGKVYDPAGAVPLYNVIVYVPNAPLAAISEGASCEKCNGTASGSPVASALSDSSGRFVLEDVPAGSDIPLVIQVGKWRREVVIPEVMACADTSLVKDLTRLPRHQNEGHIPRIAVSTGHADALECLLRKVGIAESEFTTDAGTGRVHMFVGGKSLTEGAGADRFIPTLNAGAAFPAASTLWGSPDNMRNYDMILLSCESSQYGEIKDPYVTNVKSYADKGGRLFLDHLHSYWMRKGAAPWPVTATYVDSGKDLPMPFTLKIDETFPKGLALTEWLVNVGASPTRGLLQIYQGQYSVAATKPGVSQRWLYIDANPNDPTMRPGVEYMTFNTPVEDVPDNQCGRVVFTDLHVVSAAGASTDVSHPENPFPSGCTSATLSPQELALEFMLFDLSSCVLPDVVKPRPPVIE